MKMQSAVEEYLVEIEVRKYTPKTIRSYRCNLNLFLRFCAEKLHVETVEALTPAVVRQFSRCMSEAGRKGTYINKQRVVPITPVLKKAMLRYESGKEKYFMLRPHDAFYFLSFHGRQLTDGAVEYVLRKRGAGIEGVRVSPHTCRHFFAQQQVKMGTDLLYDQSFAGA